MRVSSSLQGLEFPSRLSALVRSYSQRVESPQTIYCPHPLGVIPHIHLILNPRRYRFAHHAWTVGRTERLRPSDQNSNAVDVIVGETPAELERRTLLKFFPFCQQIQHAAGLRDIAEIGGQNRGFD